MKNIIPLTLVLLISGTLAYNYLSDSVENQMQWNDNLPTTEQKDTTPPTNTRRVPENNYNTSNDTQVIVVDPQSDPFRRQQESKDTSYEEAVASKQAKEATIWDVLNQSYIYKNPNDMNIFITIKFIHIYLAEDKETPKLYKINITYTSRSRTQSSTVFLAKANDKWECKVFSHWLRVKFASDPPLVTYQGQTYLPQ